MYGSPVDLSKCMGHRSSFPIIRVTGHLFQVYGSPVVLSNCMGHQSSFSNIRVTSRPFQMYGSPVDLSKCMGHRSSFAIIRITGRPFAMYGSLVDLSKCMGHRSSFPIIRVTGLLFPPLTRNPLGQSEGQARRGPHTLTLPLVPNPLGQSEGKARKGPHTLSGEQASGSAARGRMATLLVSYSGEQASGSAARGRMATSLVSSLFARDTSRRIDGPWTVLVSFHKYLIAVLFLSLTIWELCHSSCLGALVTTGICTFLLCDFCGLGTHTFGKDGR
jgi:hypothetical protein